MENRELLIALNMIPMLGPKRIESIAQKFKSLSEFTGAARDDFTSVPGISRKLADHIQEYRRIVDPGQEMEKAEKMGVNIVTLPEEDYPEQLKEIYDPPPVLYILGDASVLKNNSVAIVGTRKATVYGKNVATSIAKDLASLSINVVSGMARGIDTFAHKGAVAVGGPTTAVWGSGIDVVYPPENRALACEIAKVGCIVTCFPLGQKPSAGNFPARNRIISGLSLGVLVVEAAEKSGSLITADFALEQGREVFAVPGGIFSPYSRGSHKIIKQGAKLVENVHDILSELYIESDDNPIGERPDKSKLLSEEEKSLVGLIDFYPTHIEEIIHRTQKSSQEINIALTQLELRGVIAFLAGGYVMRV